MSFYFLPLRKFTSKTVLHISRNVTLNQFSKSDIHLKVRLLPLNKSLPCIYRKDIRFASSDSYVSILERSSIFQKITENPFVLYIQEKLIDFHDMSGLPWWSVIILSTIAVRTFIIFPLAVHQQVLVAKAEIINKEMENKVKSDVTKEILKLSETKNLTSFQMEFAYARLMSNHQREQYVKHNGHPFKHIILIGVQIPIWASMSSAFRNLAAMLPVQDITAYTAFLEMKASGFGIIKDLTMPDYTLTLALIACIANTINLRLNRMSKMLRYNKLNKTIFSLVQIFCLITVPISLDLPKCITLYWATSSLFALLQNMLFLSPMARRLLRIPEMDKRRPHMFQYVKNKIKGFIYFWRY